MVYPVDRTDAGTSGTVRSEEDPTDHGCGYILHRNADVGIPV